MTAEQAARLSRLTLAGVENLLARRLARFEERLTEALRAAEYDPQDSTVRHALNELQSANGLLREYRGALLAAVAQIELDAAAKVA